MNISTAEIKKQFNRIVKAGWLPWFQEAAKTAGTSTAHLLAIGSRETNLKNIRGDFRDGVYHGFGVMQVDIGTDPQYCRNWTPDNVEHGITRGGEILKSKIDQVVAGQGQILKFKGRQFTGRRCEPDDIRRIATAAYNCGLWAYYHFSRGEHVDSTTTGHDYSRDVYERAVYFAELLEKGGHETDAIDNEVLLQGKYLAPQHQERLLGAVDVVKMPIATPAEEFESEPAPSVAPIVAVAPVETVAAPVPGGGVDDPAKQASTGGHLSRVLATIGGATGIGTAIKGMASGTTAIIIAGIVCATLIFLTIMFRQILLDWLRMKLHADPSKINVK